MTASTHIAEGPFQPTWQSLSQYQIPRWYQDAKFGIFIHWGVYSVPAFGSEWYPRNMYQQGTKEFQHHITTYGAHAQFGYKDFIPQFTAEHYDPDQWAALFRQAGARFVMPVAEHHDGFPLYDCSFTEWSATRMGPKRDLIGELAEAVRKQWLIFAVSSHRAENWWFYDGGALFNSDVRDPRYAGLYGPAQQRDSQPNDAFLQDWLARSCELVDKYQPQIVWFDWWIEQPSFVPYLQRFAAHYYNRAAEWGIEVAINYKHQAFPERAAVYDIERGQLTDIRYPFWQADTAVAKNSWGFTEGQDYKTATALVGDLIDIVSKNGALLLNIGPRPDGTIPDDDAQRLLDIGSWLGTNGEAVYDSRPWKVYGEGPTQVIGGTFNDTKREAFCERDIRFTTRGETLYATLLGWPTNKGETLIQSLGTDLRLYSGDIERVEMLGHNEPLKWSRTSRGLKVKLPDQQPCKHAWVLKVLPKN
jgi:alpha-L-fucosidase